MDSLKDLLKSHNISLDTEKAVSGQIGQENKLDLSNPENSLNQQNKGGCRLVWFRTLAFQANDPGFKSRRPHQSSFFMFEFFVVRLLSCLEAYQAQATQTLLHPNQRPLTRGRLQRINLEVHLKPLVQI